MPHRKSSKPTRKVARPTTHTTGRNPPGSSRGSTQEARRPTPPSVSPPEPPVVSRAMSLSPHELYRHEKRRRAGQPRADGRDPLEEARREFKAMLEAGAGTPRGGRPRKVKPRAEDDTA
jgi:hypothetical protein